MMADCLLILFVRSKTANEDLPFALNSHLCQFFQDESPYVKSNEPHRRHEEPSLHITCHFYFQKIRMDLGKKITGHATACGLKT